MSDKDYSGYDDLIRSIMSDKDDNVEVFTAGPGVRRRLDPRDADAEIFMTSEDIVKQEELRREEEETTGRRRRGLEPGQIEETVHFKQYNKLRERKYTEAELAKFRAGCERVIVHDYGANDFYHISDKERNEHDQLAKINIELGGLKSLYRRADQYVLAMRVVYKAWNMLAENNPLHSKDEFFDYLRKGLIGSNRIISPKLKGLDKYNQDILIEYIVNDSLDPADLAPKKDDFSDYYYDDEYDEDIEAQTLLDESEIEYLATHDEAGDGLVVEDIRSKDVKALDDELNYITKRRRKVMKKKDKKKNRIQKTTVGILKQIQQDHYQRGNYYGVAWNYFEDNPENKPSFGTPYGGSWRDDDAVEMYAFAIDQEERNKSVSGDSYLTYADKELDKFFRTLEEKGVNTIELKRKILGSTESINAKKVARAKKQNRKMERQVINRIKSLSGDPKFKKLIKKSEKAISEADPDDLTWGRRF